MLISVHVVPMLFMQYATVHVVPMLFMQYATVHVVPILFMQYATVHHQLLLLLKKVGSARLREGDIHPFSLKNPAPQYQPVDRNKRTGKRAVDCNRDIAA